MSKQFVVQPSANHYRLNSKIQKDLAQEFLGKYSFKPGSIILDIGCRDGHVAQQLSQMVPEANIYAIDSSSSMIECAQTLNSKITWICGHIEDVKLDIKFDLIFSMSLHWMQNPITTLQTSSQFLKTNGDLLLITFPQESPYWQFIDDALAQHSIESFRKQMLTTDQIAKELECLNLKNVEVLKEIRLSIYEDITKLKNYIRGWISYYAPIEENDIDSFLDNSINKSAQKFLQPDNTYCIPYLLVRIKSKSA
ncbi:MAG: methyltransferase domain-containing protein [Parachlamydiales bacterium]|nr:methyltransferase domain-containing protein [Parachlamydiales bacterium]